MSAVRFGLLALLWGSSFLWIKLALRGFNPVQISFVRLALGAFVLAAVVVVRRLGWPRDRRTWMHLAVAALLGNALPYTLFAIAEQTVGSNVAGILNATTPLWTVAAVALVSATAIGWRAVIGVVVGFLGVVLVLDPFSLSASSFGVGEFACLAAAACYAASYVYIERYLAGSDRFAAVTLAGAQLAASTVWLATAMPVAGLDRAAWRADAVWSLLVLGVLGTGAAYLLNYRLIADLGSAKASTVIYLLPLVAVALGWLVLREPVGPLAGVGAALIIAGIYLVRQKRAASESSSGGSEPQESGLGAQPSGRARASGRGAQASGSSAET